MRDIVVIGGGAVGLWSAWHLHKAGVRVTIIDKSAMQDGCSYGNAGMIVPSHFIPMASPGIIAQGIRWMFKKKSPFYIRPRASSELMRWLWLFYRSASSRHVADSVSLLRDMHTESRELYRDLDRMPGFGFGFSQKGILMLFQTPGAESDELETAEIAHQLGIEANYLTLEQLTRIEPALKVQVKGAVHYPGDAHLSPEIMMRQLKAALLAEGVECMTHTEATAIIDDHKNGVRIHTKNGETIPAKNVVLSAGSWSSKLMSLSGFSLPVQDGKGYSMTVHQPNICPSIPAILHEARVAITPMGTNLRISGTLEISGMDEIISTHKVRSILDAVPGYYPQLHIHDPGPVWFGYRPCTPDGLPYIGRWSEDSAVIVATGHAMMGLSLAPVTGRMVKDLVTGNATLHQKLNPARFAGK